MCIRDRSGLDRRAQVGADLLVRQGLAEEGLRGGPQPPQVQVQATHAVSAHLQRREVRVAGERQRRQVRLGGGLAVELNGKGIGDVYKRQATRSALPPIRR